MARAPGFRADHCILKLMPGRLCNLGGDTKQERYQINDQANLCCDMLHSGHKQAEVIDKDYGWQIEKTSLKWSYFCWDPKEGKKLVR